MAFQLNSQTRLVLRAEVWRDGKGAFVAAFPRANDAFDLGLGRPNTAIAGSSATYSAMTLGVTRVLPEVGPLRNVKLRPELRYDRALAGRPFDQATRRSQFTLGIDAVIPFSVGKRKEIP
jgi:hypothetical protein